MNWRSITAGGVLLVASVGCQGSSMIDVTPTETVAPAAASASVWGEVPKQCA
jgi:hypothetical protein